jgi:DNA-binding NarL/FixJ family response regulator
MNSNSGPICKILVQHTDPLVRAGIVASLRQHIAFDVCEAGSQAKSRVLDPIDVVIADYQQAMRQLAPDFLDARPSPPATRVLIVTSNERGADIERAIRAGVHGYVLLGGPLSELLEGVQMVAQGSRYLSHAASRRMVDSLSQPCLTSRELDVLDFVVAGSPNKVIARHLNISLGTVKTHVRAIMAKLNATSRTQATNIALTHGLVGERAPNHPASQLPAAPRPVFAAQADA